MHVGDWCFCSLARIWHYIEVGEVALRSRCNDLSHRVLSYKLNTCANWALSQSLSHNSIAIITRLMLESWVIHVLKTCVHMQPPCLTLYLYIHPSSHTVRTYAPLVSHCTYTCAPCLTLYVHMRPLSHTVRTHAPLVSHCTYTCTPCLTVRTHVPLVSQYVHMRPLSHTVRTHATLACLTLYLYVYP